MSAPLNDRILAAARDWIGTPHVFGASLRGVGCDCVGLARGVWAEATGLPLPSTGPIAPDWHLEKGAGAILRAARPFTDAVQRDDMRPGDFALFRTGAHRGPQHLGVLSETIGALRMIHCVDRMGVVETGCGPSFAANLVCILRARAV